MIQDFSEDKPQFIARAARKRYGGAVPFEWADVQMQFDPAMPVPTVVPAVCRAQRGADFFVVKTAAVHAQIGDLQIEEVTGFAPATHFSTEDQQ